ncbi:MAG: N-acetylneuraminate synthase, partial [Candidatus Omnitrophica bacterium]|nr:N-acetylneuraminate synthase [Candidatus Omnitrophota bacterium]
IAEVGVNHNGDIEIAKQLVDLAYEAGVDAVKFQTFSAEKVVSQQSLQLDMLKKLELSRQDHIELNDYCREKGVIFLSTPFDLESIDFLKSLGLEIFKIPSGEITNLPYLRKVGSLNKKIIISTGMAELEEISKALDILVASGTAKEKITVLHCNTEYPTPFKDVNLLAMLTIKNTLRVKVGYSDHTLGIEVPIAAVALGAEVVEKHFTLDRTMEGPDHQASLEPSELKAMVESIRKIKNALGDGIKRVSPSELHNREVVRKSIVASREIKKGEILSQENITAKRPGVGISPIEWDRVIGRVAKRCFKADEAIEV